MNIENSTDKLTRKAQIRAIKIAEAATLFPEREQDQLFYMIQGYLTFKSAERMAQNPNGKITPRVAAL